MSIPGDIRLEEVESFEILEDPVSQAEGLLSEIDATVGWGEEIQLKTYQLLVLAKQSGAVFALLQEKSKNGELKGKRSGFIVSIVLASLRKHHQQTKEQAVD